MDPTTPPVDPHRLRMRLIGQRCQEYALYVLPPPQVAYGIGRVIPPMGPVMLLYIYWYGSLVSGLKANAVVLHRDAMLLKHYADRVFGTDSHRDSDI